ncbi:MAG: hypothetical protein IJX13_04125 [Clostridia bacterium]|nr:hypothetical protein [Clostridia bacterium]
MKAKNKRQSKESRLGRFRKRFVKKVRANKLSFSVYVLMGAITVSVIVLTAVRRQFESTFTACISLILFLLPTFVEESFRIKLPTALEIVAVLFVFCANILGEIGAYYTRFPFWDDMLHYTSGFIFAAFGFALVDIFNRHRDFDFHLSPLFLSIVALCFSVTVGALWELFEFGADLLLHTDMQKDTVITQIYSAELNPNGQAPVSIPHITETVIKTADGAVYTLQGYLDIGLFDSMKDLLVDLAGALLFCIIGYFYTSNSAKGRIAKQFVPRVEGELFVHEDAKQL